MPSFTLTFTPSPYSSFSSFSLLFTNPSLNTSYLSLCSPTLNPLIIFITIPLFSLALFIYLLLSNCTYIDVIILTISLLLSSLSLLIYLLLKHNCISTSNIHFIEILLLTISFILFTLLTQIISTQLHITAYTLSLEIIIKCIWIVFIMNEFIFICSGNIVNIIIVTAYNCKENIEMLIAYIMLFLCNCMFAYYITRFNKEWFVYDKMRFRFAGKESAFMDFGYLRINGGDMMIIEKNEYINKAFMNCDNEDIMSLLCDIDEMNNDIKEQLVKIAKDEKERNDNEKELNKEIDICQDVDLYNNGKAMISKFHSESNNKSNNNHNDTSTIHFIKMSSTLHHNHNINNNNSLHENDSSCIGEPHLIKRGAHSQIITNNTPTTKILSHPSQTPSKRHSTTLLPFKKTTLSVNLNHPKPIYNLNFDFLSKSSHPPLPPLNNTLHSETAFLPSHNPTSPFSLSDPSILLPLLLTYLKRSNLFTFTYLGKRKINLKEYSNDPSQNIGMLTSRTVFRGSVDKSPTDITYFNVYIRYNMILNSLEFVFVDESKNQYESIFKSYSKQTSMYLHDFKNPLIAINEKIMEYRDAFESIFLECDDNENQIACFQYGKSEVDDFNFLSVTSNDCVGMIKSYEDFARAFSEGTEIMKVNLSLFPLYEITKYLQDWMNMKIAHSSNHSSLIFNINTHSIPQDYYIYSDQLKLKRILINIISNSFKFTLDGSITLHISKEKIDNIPYMKFLIKDTGSGMDDATMKNLFNPYFSNNTDKRNKEGCGLGLILAMRMSKSIGIGIKVRSEVNKGTEMWFYAEEKEKPESVCQHEKDSSKRLDSIKQKTHYSGNLLEIENNSIAHSFLSSERNKMENKDTLLFTKQDNIRHNRSTKLSMPSSKQHSQFIQTFGTLSTYYNELHNKRMHPSPMNAHTLIDEDFLSIKRSLHNNKLITSPHHRYSSHFSKSPKKRPKIHISLSRKSLCSYDNCDTTINDDLIIAVNPHDKPIIPHNTMRQFAKSNSVICGSNFTLSKSTIIHRPPHQITLNNSNIHNYNYRQSLILYNTNEDSNFSGLSISKQEAAVSIEAKSCDNGRLLSPTPTFNATASGMNCNKGYNYHKMKSNITSFLGGRSMISKKETRASDNGGVKKGGNGKKNVSVLVVDDDENFQKSYRRVLEGLGVEEIVCVNDGVDLLIMFMKGDVHYDVVIMDNFMTFVDGTEAVRVIKCMKDMGVGKKNVFDYGILKKIHIATSAQDLAMSCLEELDCIEFVEKPIGKEAMEGIIKKCAVK